MAGAERLAGALFEARQFEQAAGLYRRLKDDAEGDTHLLLMLALCERNAGNDAEARRLLAELQAADQQTAEWAGWLTTMMDLGGQGAEEVQ